MVDQLLYKQAPNGSMSNGNAGASTTWLSILDASPMETEEPRFCLTFYHPYIPNILSIQLVDEEKRSEPSFLSCVSSPGVLKWPHRVSQYIPHFAGNLAIESILTNSTRCLAQGGFAASSINHTTLILIMLYHFESVFSTISVIKSKYHMKISVDQERR